VDRVEREIIDGCFVPKTIQHNDRIVKDDKLWSPNPKKVNGSMHLTNNATTFPRGPGDVRTEKKFTISALQKDILIGENDLNYVAYHDQFEKSVVKNITSNAK